MISKDQANQILVLATNYANYESCAETLYAAEMYSQSDKMNVKAQETWLKLKEIVESITEE